MFFHLSNTVDPNFPNHYKINNGYVNCDTGWTQYSVNGHSVLVKGYADNVPLNQLIYNWDQNDTGNYCVIRATSNVEIKHSINRGFPLFYQHNAVTNFYNNDPWQPLWADDSVCVDQDWNVRTQKISLDFSINYQSDPVNFVFDQLVADVKNFFKTNKIVPKIYCSGGVDTVLLVALLEYTKQPYQLITEEHYELDFFTSKNQEHLKNFWAYNQIHHWTDSTCLVTGGCGDEYFLRGPATIAMLTAWHDIDFQKILQPQHYHYRYFHKYPDTWTVAWTDRQHLREKYPTQELLKKQILNMLYNDHQHWHLGNTITWCPFKNIKIAQTLLSMNINDLLPQFCNAEITKQLIVRACPAMLSAVSSQKNHNSSENLSILYDLLQKSQ